MSSLPCHGAGLASRSRPHASAAGDNASHRRASRHELSHSLAGRARSAAAGLRRRAALLGLPLLLGAASAAQAYETIAITAPPDAFEGHSGLTNHTFKVRLSGSVSGDVNYKVCFSGAATYAVDYNPTLGGAQQSSNCVQSSIPAGQTAPGNSNAIGIAVVGDGFSETGRWRGEYGETVTAKLTLVGAQPWDLAGRVRHTVTHTILNDDVAVSFRKSDFEGREGKRARIQVDLVEGSHGHSQSITVPFTYTRGTAQLSDFDRSRTSVTFRRGQTSRDLYVDLPDDSNFESDESFRIDFDTAGFPAGMYAPEITQTTVTIKDNDYSISTNEGSYAAREDAGGVSITVTIAPAQERIVGLRVSFQNVSTHAGVDYLTEHHSFPDGVLTFYPGETTKSFLIPVVNDGVFENNELFHVTLTQTVGPTDPLSRDVIIRDLRPGDGDYTSKLTLERTSGDTVSERQDATFRLKMHPAVQQSSTVAVMLAQSADDGERANWIAGAPQTRAQYVTVDFTGGDSEKTLTVRIRSDGRDTNGTLTVAAMTPGAHPKAAGTYTARGQKVSAKLRIQDTTADGDPQASAQQTAALQIPSTAVSNVQVTAVDGTTAKATWDAVPHATGYRVEFESTSDVSPANYVYGAANGVTGTAWSYTHNAAEAMTLTVTVTPELREDGNVQQFDGLAGTATIKVGPSGTGGSDSVDDGATDATDSQTGNSPPASCVSDAQWDQVAGYYDSNANKSPNYGANWYRVLIAYRQARPEKALPAWGGATAQPTAAYTAYEAEDGEEVWSGWTPVREVLECLEKPQTSAPQPEPPPDPELSLSAGSAVDEGTSASFTIHADSAPASAVTVNVSVAQGGDWLASPGAGTRSITLAAGATTTSLAVATVNDGTDEPDGSVSVSLNAGTGYTVASSNASATVAVRDDDEPVPEVSISAGGDVSEGAAASFTVTASPAPASPLDVDVTVAQSGDFAASGQTGSRTVTIPSSGSATLAIATVDDGTDEPDGSVSAAINAGAGYAVSSPNGAATVAVRDDDDPPSASSCVSGTQWRTVEGYYQSNAGKAPNYGANWYRVLIAYRSEHTHRALPAWTGPTAEPTASFTVKEAEDGEKVWSGWTPVREALECLRKAGRIGRSFVPLVPGSANPAGEGVVRFANRSPRAGTVRIAATDDAGWRPAPVTLRLGPGGSVALTTRDLERGNAAKGLDGAVGAGTGDWRLDVSSGLDLGVQPFVRAADGATAAMHGVAEQTEGVHRVWTFNPAGELAQSSLLRVMNLGAEPATARITGIDDAGLPSGAVTLEIPARAAVQLTAADLEGGGPGIHGMLGDGHGRWRLRVASEGELAVMNLAVSPFGHLTNLSDGGFPALRSGRTHSVPYVPPASDGLGRLGLVRVINESARGGEVRVLAHDATGRRHGPLTLRLGPGGAAHFNSWDLELGGEAGSGLSGGTGPGVGAWRLEITSGLDLEVRSYVATPTGSLKTTREFVAGPGLLRGGEAFEEDR